MSAARIVFLLLAIVVALFCVFGFLASFEGNDSRMWAFRIGYGVVGFAALAAGITAMGYGK